MNEFISYSQQLFALVFDFSALLRGQLNLNWNSCISLTCTNLPAWSLTLSTETAQSVIFLLEVMQFPRFAQVKNSPYFKVVIYFPPNFFSGAWGHKYSSQIYRHNILFHPWGIWWWNVCVWASNSTCIPSIVC
jgi:hypothetical protein